MPTLLRNLLAFIVGLAIGGIVYMALVTVAFNVRSHCIGTNHGRHY